MYYGFRYFSNRTCTIGSPNPKTGRYSIAGDFEIFGSIDGLNAWIGKERLSEPCGNGGGERVRVTKKELRKLCCGMSVENFNQTIEMKKYAIEVE